jgi:hypothetical protein
MAIKLRRFPHPPIELQRSYLDPELPFKIGYANERKARESGLRPKAYVAPIAASSVTFTLAKGGQLNDLGHRKNERREGKRIRSARRPKTRGREKSPGRPGKTTGVGFPGPPGFPGAPFFRQRTPARDALARA